MHETVSHLSLYKYLRIAPLSMGSDCVGVLASDYGLTFCNPKNDPGLGEKPIDLDPTHVELVMI